MPQRRAWSLLALSALGAVATLAVSSSSDARQRCPGEVVAANRYWTITYENGDPFTYLSACDRRRRHRPQLNISAADVAGPAAALRGPLIALSETFYETTGGPTVAVINPNNPRATYQLLQAPAYGNVSDIVLQDQRRIAWISCRLKLPDRRDKDDPQCPGGVTKRIYVVDASSPELKPISGGFAADEARLLATGRTIRSRSLRIDTARLTISWRKGNRTMRYRLR